MGYNYDLKLNLYKPWDLRPSVVLCSVKFLEQLEIKWYAIDGGFPCVGWVLSHKVS